MPKNLDLFEKITTNILAECFENFPVACSFCAERFCEENNKLQFDVFYYTIKWLVDNGYLLSKQAELCQEGRVVGVELTEKGLRILHEKVDVLGIDGKLGSLMKKACKAGGEALASEAVKHLLAIGSQIYL